MKYINVDSRKLARNGWKMAILAGGWGRLPIDEEYAARLWRLFGVNAPSDIISPKCDIL